MPLAKRILQEATIFLLIKDYSAFSVFSSSAGAWKDETTHEE